MYTWSSFGVVMKKLIVLLMVAAAGSLFAQSKSQGAIAPDANMISLMNEAKRLMKTKDDIPFPEIHSASLDYLKSLVCNNSSYCPVTAVYHENKIYYRQDLDLNSSFTKSILVHEFIHHIQANSGFVAIDCNIWYKNEKEAYRLQAKYLRNNDQDDSLVREAVRIIKCP
jgi:hypothetical protein